MKRQRREFSQSDKIAIRGRATDGGGRVFCEKCGVWIKSRKGYEFHHLIPEGMRPLADLKRKLTPADGRSVVHPMPWRGDAARRRQHRRSQKARAEATSSQRRQI